MYVYISLFLDNSALLIKTLLYVYLKKYIYINFTVISSCCSYCSKFDITTTVYNIIVYKSVHKINKKDKLLPM